MIEKIIEGVLEKIKDVLYEYHEGVITAKKAKEETAEIIEVYFEIVENVKKLEEVSGE